MCQLLTNREYVMSQLGIRPVILAATLTAFVAPLFIGSASAQQQTAREKAWAKCLTLVNQLRPASSSGDNESERVAAFKACMAKEGINP
jgi:hypothetical protein